MILKGSQRKGAYDLALHLQNEVENEKVTIAEIKGMVSDDLYDGFREWGVLCEQTKASEPFYSLSINPDPNQRDLTEEEWIEAIDHIEKEMGLEGQPRVVIFHEKVGNDGKVRRHCHVVWCRIKYDHDKGKFIAVHMGNDYYKLKRCAKELSRKFGLQLGYGDNKNSRNKNASYDHAKSHGKGRDVESTKTRKAKLTRLWDETDTAEEFKTAALKEGYVIAKGEKAAFVVVDEDGQVHSLTRQLDGTNTKAVKARMGNPDNYPSVEQAKEEQKIRNQQKLEAAKKAKKQKTERIDLSRQQRQMEKLRRMAIRADRLNQSRNHKLKIQKEEMEQLHKSEWLALIEQQQKQYDSLMKQRTNNQPRGLIAIAHKITGIDKLTAFIHRMEDKKKKQRDLAEQQQMQNRQQAERKRMERITIRKLQQEKWEARSIQKFMKKISSQNKRVLNSIVFPKNQVEDLNKDQKNAKYLRLGY